MKKIAIAVAVALCLAVAKPAYANIVWATFAPIVCAGSEWELYAHIVANSEEYVAWFLMNDPSGWLHIVTHGGTPEAIGEAISAGIDAGGGCNG